MPKLHHEVTFAAPPARVYRALMDSAQHAAFTGAAATVSPEVGGAFSAHEGHVEGRNVELVPDRRIVQTWRTRGWPEGVWSLIRYELVADGAGTRLSFDHDAIPDGESEHLDAGWKARYWEPLAKYLDQR